MRAKFWNFKSRQHAKKSIKRKKKIMFDVVYTCHINGYATSNHCEMLTVCNGISYAKSYYYSGCFEVFQ